MPASSGIGPTQKYAATRAGILLAVYGGMLFPAMAAVRYASIHLEAPDVLSYGAVLAARMQAACSSSLARYHAEIFCFGAHVQVRSLSGQL